MIAFWGLVVVSCPKSSHAGLVTVSYTGRTTSSITVGGHTIPNGSLFSGRLTYDFPQPGTITSFRGGTQSIFTFNSLTWTIGTETVTESAGQIGLYNDVTTSTSGVPNGDSFYTFVPGIPNTPPPATGSIDGVAPNFIYLGLVDPTGNAFTGSGLPQSLSLAEFSPSPKEAFLGVNYGPLGAGNIVTIFPLTSLTSSAIPEPGSAILLATGMCVLPAMAVRRKKRRAG